MQEGEMERDSKNKLRKKASQHQGVREPIYQGRTTAAPRLLLPFSCVPPPPKTPPPFYALSPLSLFHDTPDTAPIYDPPPKITLSTASFHPCLPLHSAALYPMTQLARLKPPPRTPTLFVLIVIHIFRTHSVPRGRQELHKHHPF